VLLRFITLIYSCIPGPEREAGTIRGGATRFYGAVGAATFKALGRDRLFGHGGDRVPLGADAMPERAVDLACAHFV